MLSTHNDHSASMSSRHSFSALSSSSINSLAWAINNLTDGPIGCRCRSSKSRRILSFQCSRVSAHFSASSRVALCKRPVPLLRSQMFNVVRLRMGYRRSRGEKRLLGCCATDPPQAVFQLDSIKQLKCYTASSPGRGITHLIPSFRAARVEPHRRSLILHIDPTPTSFARGRRRRVADRYRINVPACPAIP